MNSLGRVWSTNYLIHEEEERLWAVICDSYFPEQVGVCVSVYLLHKSFVQTFNGPHTSDLHWSHQPSVSAFLALSELES